MKENVDMRRRMRGDGGDGGENRAGDRGKSFSETARQLFAIWKLLRGTRRRGDGDDDDSGESTGGCEMLNGGDNGTSWCGSSRDVVREATWVFVGGRTV